MTPRSADGVTIASQGEEAVGVDLRTISAVARRRWRVITACLVIGVLAGAAAAVLLPGRYQSITTISIEPAAVNDYGSAYQGTLLAGQRVAVYVPLVTQPRVTEAVAVRVGEGLTARDIERAVGVNAPEGTSLMSIVVTGNSPEQAQAIANATADATIGLVDQVERAGSPTGTPVVRAVVLQEASFSPIPVSSSPVLQILLGALLGLVAGGVAAAVRESFDRSVPDATVLATLVGAPVLGEVHLTDVGARGERPADDTASERVEELRTVRAGIVLRLGDAQHQVVAIGSAQPGEGAVAVTAGLASVLGATGRSVLVVEADIRSPQLATMTGLDPSQGLCSTGGVSDRSSDDWPASAVQSWSEKVDVLTSGWSAEDPGAILGDGVLGRALMRLRQDYDIILLVLPPSGLLADAALAVAHADATVLIVRRGGSTRDDIERARKVLDGNGRESVGVVYVRADLPPSPEPAGESELEAVAQPMTPPSSASSSVFASATVSPSEPPDAPTTRVPPQSLQTHQWTVAARDSSPPNPRPRLRSLAERGSVATETATDSEPVSSANTAGSSTKTELPDEPESPEET